MTRRAAFRKLKMRLKKFLRGPDSTQRTSSIGLRPFTRNTKPYLMRSALGVPAHDEPLH